MTSMCWEMVYLENAGAWMGMGNDSNIEVSYMITD